MIPILRSQRYTLIAANITESAMISRAMQPEYLQEEDWENNPHLYNHCETELESIEA